MDSVAPMVNLVVVISVVPTKDVVVIRVVLRGVFVVMESVSRLAHHVVVRTNTCAVETVVIMIETVVMVFAVIVQVQLAVVVHVVPHNVVGMETVVTPVTHVDVQMEKY